MALQQLAQALPAFKAAVDGGSGDFSAAKSALTKLKLLMTELPSQQAAASIDAGVSVEEAALCREVLDYAVLLSVKTNDVKGFERHAAQARLYYGYGGESGDALSRRLLITGLHLMLLLVEKRLGEFHMRLETVPDGERTAEPIALPLRLESLLAEGSYNKVLAARAGLSAGPMALFAPLLDRLLGTVRDNIAECASAAYATLKVSDAVALLRLSSPAELERFIAASGLPWATLPGQPDRLALGGGREHKPSLDAQATMRSMLAYATDVERIV